MSLIDLDREIVRREGLPGLIRLAWEHVEPGVPYVHNWHIDEIADHLEALRTGQIRKLLITIPPGHMKSLTCSVFWPVYVWLLDPTEAFVGTSFDSGLTLRDARKSKELIQSEWFQSRWGHIVSIDKDAAAGEHENSRGGWRFATSFGGKMTGRHPSIMMADDAHKPKGITRASLEETRATWRSTFANRGRDQRTIRRLMIGQRLHKLDLPAYFLEEEKDWVHLNLPMRYKKANPCYTKIGGDRRTEDGELLFPERFPAEVCDALDATLGSKQAAAQNGQEPADEEGLIFKRIHFLNREITERPARFDFLCQSWDMTFKSSDSSDFVSGQVWGKKGGEFWLLDRVNRRMSFTESVKEVIAMRGKWPMATKILIEDKANGTAIEDILRGKISGIELVNPQGGKVARANAVSPFFEAGNVFIPATCDCPWVGEWENQLADFPTGSNDDDVDATSQALLWLHLKGARGLAGMKNVNMDELMKRFAL